MTISKLLVNLSVCCSQKAENFLVCVPNIELIFILFRCDLFIRHLHLDCTCHFHDTEWLVIDFSLGWLTNLYYGHEELFLSISGSRWFREAVTQVEIWFSIALVFGPFFPPGLRWRSSLAFFRECSGYLREVLDENQKRRKRHRITNDWYKTFVS